MVESHVADASTSVVDDGGVSLALVLGAGGVLTASATTSSEASSYVPITSRRLLDTRSGSDNVGPRRSPETRP